MSIADIAVALGSGQNKILITVDTMWKIPIGVNQITVSACAAGGNPNAGQFMVKERFRVNQGEQISIVVGRGNTIIGSPINRTLVTASYSGAFSNDVLGYVTGINGNAGANGSKGGDGVRAGGDSSSSAGGGYGTNGGAGGYGGAFGYGGGGTGGSGGGGGCGSTNGANGNGGAGGYGGGPVGALQSNAGHNQGYISAANAVGNGGRPEAYGGDGGVGGRGCDAGGYGAGGGLMSAGAGTAGGNWEAAARPGKGGAANTAVSSSAPGMVFIEW